MKNIYLYLLILTVIALSSCSRQENPKEYFIRPCEFICDYPFDEVNKYAVTCRVWGLLKYYHPNVTAGKVDWDKVLLDILDEIRFSPTRETVNADLKKMLDAAGQYTYKEDRNWNDSMNMNRNLCWIDNSFMDESLRGELRKIASMKVEYPGHYSIELDSVTRFFVCSNEKTQSVRDNSLLTMFRYWNVIYYFFPYKYKMTQSWDKTLTQLLPLFMEATGDISLDVAMKKLAAKIDDGHGGVNTGSYDKYIIGILETVDNKTVVRKACGGLEKGDIILSVDGRDIRQVRDSMSCITSASNQLSKDYLINMYIGGMLYYYGKSIVISRNSRQINLHLEPPVLENEDRVPYRKINDDIGYVDLDIFKREQVKSMFEAFSDTKGIIFDLRNYPKATNFFFDDIIGYFTDEDRIPYLQFTSADHTHPGAFFWASSDAYGFTPNKYPIRLYHPKYKGKFVVLTNECTASAAETATVMYRTAGDATLIGRPTAGANGNVVRIPLPNNKFAMFSGLGTYNPDRSETQRTGIIPDIEVYPTMESIKIGKDEILEAAIEYLEKENKVIR
ncbi:MAG: hypothetical protein LBG96_10450 [Tannerella sp.]|jgi:C-terminal processing protease CtpA/Prc|nr:hypothetical protein [Tannerella sp.]